MEFIDITIEKKVLKGMFEDQELLLYSMNKGNLPPELFSDKSLRIIYKNLTAHYTKTGMILPRTVLDSKINRFKTSNKDQRVMKEKLEATVDKLFLKGFEAPNKKNFKVYIEELVTLFEGRELQKYNMSLFELLDSSNIEDAKELQKSFLLQTYGDEIDSSEICENFKEREFYIKERFRNPNKYALFATGIKTLDESLGGGIGSELVVISGSSNAGKSFALQTIAANGKKQGKNVILFTIEMQKLEAQFRIDCNLSSLDYKFFRNPAKNYTEEKFQKWEKGIKKWNRKGGNLYVTSYKRGATMESITNKTYEIMNQIGGRIDAIIIDYLDDIETVKKHKEEKSWTSFGEISWDMHLLAKHFNNYDGTEGVPVITANQLKKQSKEISTAGNDGKTKRKLDERDTGSSPLPFRHSDVYIGIQTIIDGVISKLVLMKGRAIGKEAQIVCFQNYPYGRFHDEAKRLDFIESMPEEANELADIIGISKVEIKEDEAIEVEDSK